MGLRIQFILLPLITFGIASSGLAQTEESMYSLGNRVRLGYDDSASKVVRPLDLTIPSQRHLKSNPFKEKLDIRSNFDSDQSYTSIKLNFANTDAKIGIGMSAVALALYVSNQDRALLNEIQSHRSHKMDQVMKAGKSFAENGVQVIAASVVYALVVDEKRIVDVIPVQLKTIVTLGLMNNVLKILFHRALPSASPHNSYATTQSNHAPDMDLPSGHTTAAIITAVLVAKNLESLGPIVPAIVYTMAIVTGISRVYHNEHWVSGVLASVYSYYLAQGMLDGDEEQDTKYKFHFIPWLDPVRRIVGIQAILRERETYVPCGQKYLGGTRVDVCVIEAAAKSKPKFLRFFK